MSMVHFTAGRPRAADTDGPRPMTRRCCLPHRRTIAVLAVLISGPPHNAVAQEAKTCGWSFLSAVDTPPTLQNLALRRFERPAWLSEAQGRLHRWYRECDETAARRAVRLLQAARSRTNSSDPLLLGLLGMALVRGPEVQVPHAEGSVLRAAHHSSNSERDGARLLAGVAESTGWVEVAEELAAVATATRKDETLDLASRTLWSIVVEHDTAALWSALAEVELTRGDNGAAQRASEKGTVAGAPRAMRVAGILGMLAGRDAEGAELYLRGLALAVADSDLQPFFDDLRLLLGDDEREQWWALARGHSDWIRRKWEWRAQMAGVHLAERLGVNTRRLREAAVRYERVSFRGAAGEYPIWSDTEGAWREPLDDRGVIFLRHGEPVRELGRRGARVAWIYPGPTSKPMVFEFSTNYGRVARPDYFLAEPPPCWPRAGTDDLRIPRPPSDYATSISAYDAGLGWYYIRCETSPDIGIFAYADARAAARRDAEAGWNTESGIVRFGVPLKTGWNVYAFHDEAGPVLVNYLVVETTGIRSPVPEGLRFDFDVLLSIGDPVTETSTQLDTVLSYASTAPPPPNSSLQWALPIRVQPHDNARVTLTVRNRADSTQGRLTATTWRIPSFDGAMLPSDLVVAEARSGVLRRGTHEIAPAPGHAVFENSPFRLYYEMYGVRSGDPLSVSIQVLPAKAEGILERVRELISRRGALAVEFDEEATPDPDGVLRVEREYQADLVPGAYRVVVTVRNGRTDETVTADTNLVVAQR